MSLNVECVTAYRPLQFHEYWIICGQKTLFHEERPSLLGQQRPGCQLMRLLVKRHKHSFWSWAQRPHLHGTSRQTLGAADTETSVQLMNKQAMLCWDPDSMCFHSVTLYTYKLSVNKQTLTSVSLHSYADRKDTHFEVSEHMVRFYQSTDIYRVNSNSCFFSHLKKIFGLQLFQPYYY